MKSGNSGLPVELRMPSFQMTDQRTPWNFTSGHLYCLSSQSISILQRNFQESLVSSSLHSRQPRLEVRDLCRCIGRYYTCATGCQKISAPGICGAFDLFCLPHPREFDLESGPQGGDVCFFWRRGLVPSHVCAGHLGIHWSAGGKARLFLR